MKRTKRVLGLALAAVMCMGMLAGCGGTKNATNGTETSEKVLNIATIGETTTLSPLYMIADNRPTQKLLYEGLVKYVDGEIQPVLAEDWKLSDDGTQLTFYLRKGVTFHDGEPFNAEAAIANIESWHINPSFTSLPGVVNYTNIEAVDEYTSRTFEVIGHSVCIDDETLAEAISALPVDRRDIILLSYFLDMSDAEIANVLNMVRRSVAYRRTSTLKLLKNLMGGENR